MPVASRYIFCPMVKLDLPAFAQAGFDSYGISGRGAMFVVHGNSDHHMAHAGGVKQVQEPVVFHITPASFFQQLNIPGMIHMSEEVRNDIP